MFQKSVHIVAPSNTCDDAENILAEGIGFLEKNGFKTFVPKDIFSEVRLPFYANLREKRLELFKDAIQNTEIDIIWAFRGGNGAAEIAIDLINHPPLKDKILIGFSDITSLHLLFNQNYNLKSIHGPVIKNLLHSPETIDNIHSILDCEEQIIKLSPMNDYAKNFSCEAIITGGNATIIASTIGTAIEIDSCGKILILEDVSDPGDKVRRTLTQLEQTNKVHEAQAIILGDFTQSDDCLEWALDDFVMRNPNKPIFRLYGFGHGDKNLPILFGNKVKINHNTLSYKYDGFTRINHDKNRN
jgi:muramoyltetrapeptide carboxypeptidase